MRQPKDQVLIVIEPEGDPQPPPIIRLRGLLKQLLRDYRFRCVELRELPADGAETDRPPDEPPL